MGMQTNDWTDLVTQLCGDTPPEFVLAWIAEESGGNPCATGAITTYVKEAGIGQLYFDTPNQIVFGASLSQVRAACVGTSQKQARDLTDDEMHVQASSLCAMVHYFEGVAESQLARVAASRDSWSQRDFYCLVKLQHGLPGIPKSYLSSALFPDGCADWATFRSGVENADAQLLVNIDSGTARYGHEFGRVFDNAEKCASVLGGPVDRAQGLLGEELIPAAAAVVASAVIGKAR